MSTTAAAARRSTRSSPSPPTARVRRRSLVSGPDFVAVARGCRPTAAQLCLDRSGITPTCRGTAPSCGSRPSIVGQPCADRPGRRGASPAAPTSRSSSPTWSPDGVLLVVLRPHRLVEPLSVRRPAPRHRAELTAVAADRAEIGTPQWVFGMSPLRVRSVTAASCSPRSPDGIDSRRRRGLGGSTGRASSTSIFRYTGGHLGRRRADRRLRGRVRGRSPEAEPAVVGPIGVGPVGSTLRPPPARSRARPGTAGSRSRVASRSPRRRGRTAHALFYPPTNPDCAGPDGERRRCWSSSTAGRPPPARPQLSARPSSSGPAAASPWSTSTTAAPSATAAPTASSSTTSGASSTSTTAWPPPATWPTTGRVDADRLAIRGGSAGGYTTLCRAGIPRRVRRRRQPLRRRRSRGPGRRHPQVRVPLPRPPRRALARGRGDLPRALADPPHRRLRPAAARASRASRTRSCPRTSPR